MLSLARASTSVTSQMHTACRARCAAPRPWSSSQAPTHSRTPMALGTSQKATTQSTLTGRAATTRQENAVLARAAQAGLGICRSVRARSMQGAALLAAAPPASAASAPWQPAHAAQPRYGAFASQSTRVPHIQQNCCPPPMLHTSHDVGEGGSARRRAACAARVVHGHNPA